MKCAICDAEVSTLGMASHLRHKHKISAREYYDMFKDDHEGKCVICGKPTKFKGIAVGYAKHCSSKCAQNDPNVKTIWTDERKAKAAASREKTCIEKYGVKSVLQLDATREKTIASLKLDKTKAKRKATCIEKYGASSPFGSDEIQAKARKSTKDHFGVENPFASNEIQNKMKKQSLEKYGVERPCQSKDVKQKIADTKNNHILEFCKENDCIPITEIDVNYSIKDSIFRPRLLSFNDRLFVKNSDVDDIINYAPTQNGQSVIENEIASFVSSIYSGNIIRNTRKIISPKELDIYIPDKKLAIEVDGIYWHSTNFGADKYASLNKTKACETLGIRLIHITDWEWTNRQDICKSIISAALGIVDRIYARKCCMKTISQQELDNFLNAYHLQGSIKATYKAGLFYEDELIQVIAIGKSRFKRNETELLRMCTKSGYQIVGGFSKLMKNQPYKEVFSYLDRSKFNGAGYLSSNWIEVGHSEPSQSYYKDNQKLNRYATQKHKLSSLLDNFDSSKTESQNMTDNGWLQVYDCGTIKLCQKSY